LFFFLNNIIIVKVHVVLDSLLLQFLESDLGLMVSKTYVDRISSSVGMLAAGRTYILRCE